MPEATNAHQHIVENILLPVIKRLDIKDYHLNIIDSTTKGEGYLGRIWKARVLQQEKETNFIVKLASDDEDHRNFIKVNVVYKNEICFYTEVFPEIDQFQKEKNVKYSFKVAKCYATSLKENEEALVLEDLRAIGFTMHNRKKPLDEAHISLVLTQYGKLHALSLALRDQQPEAFKHATASLTDAFPLVMPSLIDGFVTQILKNAEMLKQQGLTAESQLANEIAAKLEEIITMKCEDPYTVVTHGDCWSNNMMFKYDDKTGKPVDHRFLDFQISRLHSPAFDLSYFFYTSAPKRVMDKVDKYLQIYYNSLSDFIRQLGSDPDTVYPFEVFMKHWKQFRNFGLAMSLFGFRFILSEEDEALSLTTKEEYANGFTKTMANQEEQDRRVTDVIKHFVEYSV